jgi:hypothetical protein
MAGSGEPGRGEPDPGTAGTGPVAEHGDPPGGPAAGGAPAVLDLHPLSDAQRRLVAQVLTARRLRHSWQGANLVVPAHLAGEAEAAVDSALGAADAGVEGPTVVYEVGGWPAGVQSRLAAMLAGAGIAHQWDEHGDLVVAEADEQAVEDLFDQIDESELAGGPDGLALLEGVHDDLARLARDPGDARARAGLEARAADLAPAEPPFGFDAPVWRRLVGGVGELAGGLRDLDDDEVRHRATALRQQVREWL